MPKKFIPYYPNTIDGQAVLNNITRTKRLLKYRDSDKVYERIKRGLPLFDVELIEQVRKSSSLQEGDLEGVRNLLIRGECIAACAYLKAKGIKVDLVYVDPPFASGADYAKKVFIRRNPRLANEIKKAEETLDDDELRSFEEKMYGDIWQKEDYLNWMYENLAAIKTIMSTTASIYVHLDWHIVHYVKLLMDELFNEENFRNEIIWCYTAAARIDRDFPKKHDTILRYSLNDEYIFNIDEVRVPYADGSVDRANRNVVGRRVMNFNKIQLNEKGKVVEDWWNDIQRAARYPGENLDYNTQKSEALLNRIISASSNKNLLVADFFSDSGVTAKKANDLGRNFIHVDVGINSIQTIRDRLIAAGADFDILEVKDGVNLFRNPIQTMDKLATLIHGLQLNKKYNNAVIPSESEESLSNFWFGAISDSKFGQVPVYVPNLIDHNQKVLDIPIINQIISQELPKLENVKKAIAYYIDLSDEKTIKNFIEENNATEIEVELRDLKQVLDEVVVTDRVEYTIIETECKYKIEINKFVSDLLIQKIDEYNQKKELAVTKTKLIEDSQNGNGDTDEAENGDEENGSENDNGNGKKKPFKKIEISDNGLELIELISLDCTNSEGVWHSSTEIKIDKFGYVVKDGTKTKIFWDGKLTSSQKPLRMKVRNIAGDEIIVKFSESNISVGENKPRKAVGKQ